MEPRGDETLDAGPASAPVSRQPAVKEGERTEMFETREDEPRWERDPKGSLEPERTLASC